MTTKPIIFCDFDGTITESDNIIAIMKQFAPNEWIALKDQVLSQQISIRYGVGEMFSLLPSSLKDEIILFIKEQTNIRAGFAQFLDYVQKESIPFYVVSGGMDFFVNPILAPFNLNERIICNHADFSSERIQIEWTHSCDSECTNDCGCCKPSVIRKLRNNQPVIVIGDSITDLEAAKQADFVFARDYLKEKCEQLKIDHKPFESFVDCQRELEKLLGVSV